MATKVSRQLKKAGFNPRVPTDFGRKEGIFVKNRGSGRVSVSVDFDEPSRAEVRLTELEETLSELGYDVERSGDAILRVSVPEPASVADNDVESDYIKQGYSPAQAKRLASFTTGVPHDRGWDFRYSAFPSHEVF
jgi:hypothetical protein